MNTLEAPVTRSMNSPRPLPVPDFHELHMADLGTFDVNHESGPTVWSPMLRAIFGLPREGDCAWEDFWKLLHPEDRGAVFATIMHSLEPTGPGCFSLEHRIVWPDGSVRWVHAAARTAFAGENGSRHPVRTVGTVSDITSRKSIEEALRDGDRHKNEFLTMLGHELRNPLAAIRSANQVLHEAARDPEVIEWAQGVIDRQSAQMVRLVDDLLDLTRAPRGTISMRREPVSLRAVIRDAVQAALPAIKRREQHLYVSLPEDPLDLVGDATRLQQVFVNLLTNACRYGGDGGHIRLQAFEREETVRVAISDDGVGIAPEMLGRIFDLFVRAESPLAAEAEGLGVGLTLVKALVELHGGTVSARSRGLGKGSQMVVSLPLGGSRNPSAPCASELVSLQSIPAAKIPTNPPGTSAAGAAVNPAAPLPFANRAMSPVMEDDGIHQVPVE